MEGGFNGLDSWFDWPVTGDEDFTSCSSSSTDFGREVNAPKTKITKKKTRSTGKRPPAAFFTADPANFAELVQQVTGSDNGRRATTTTKRKSKSVAQPATTVNMVIPTLDTSAMWLESMNMSNSVESNSSESWAVNAAECMLFGDASSWDEVIGF